MGNFYTNYALKGVSQAAVAEAMAGREAVVCPSCNDAVVVFDSKSDKQDEKVIVKLASELSAALKCIVLAVMNHDDDILWYQLYSSGERVDEYNSCPDYFEFDGRGEPLGPTGGDAAKLSTVFSGADVEQVETILRKPMLEEGYVFAFERHLDLCKALGLPEFAVGTAYASFGRDAIEGLPAGTVIRTR